MLLVSVYALIFCKLITLLFMICFWVYFHDSSAPIIFTVAASSFCLHSVPLNSKNLEFTPFLFQILQYNENVKKCSIPPIEFIKNGNIPNGNSNGIGLSWTHTCHAWYSLVVNHFLWRNSYQNYSSYSNVCSFKRSESVKFVSSKFHWRNIKQENHSWF